METRMHSPLYRAPQLVHYGRVERLTMGNNGSSWDGTHSYTQHGKGNNAYGPATGKGNPNPNGNGNGGGNGNGTGNGQKPYFPPNYHPGPPGQMKK